MNGSDRASSGLTGLDDILGGGFVLGLADSVAEALRRERSKPPSNVVKMA